MYKVVVIDDEAIVRRGIVMETDWNSLSCVVVAEAANGLEGLEVIRKYNPHICICDIRMPKMDGIDMLTALRDEGNDVQVVFLTAHGEFSYAQSALKLLAADYILKPFQDGELEAAVGRITERLEKERNSEPELISLELKSNDKSKYVMEALAYINEHFSDSDISVGAVAGELEISEGHLSHIFKKETDYTVAAYITRVRMRAAMKLLNDVRNKVYEVAEKVGYRDIAYFSNNFKKIVGITPSEYQNRRILHKKEEEQ